MVSRLSGDDNLKPWRIKISKYSECCGHAGRPAPSQHSSHLSPSSPSPPSLIQCMLSSAYSTAGTVPGTEDIRVNQTRFSFSREAQSRLGRPTQEQRNRRVTDRIPAPHSLLPRSPGEPHGAWLAVCPRPLWVGHNPSSRLPPATPHTSPWAFP